MRENITLGIAVVLSLALAIFTDGRGMPQKWHVAIFGTVLPFSFVVCMFPANWLRRWAFWVSFVICLAAHTAIIGIFFQHVFLGPRLGTFMWYPVAYVESWVLLIVVKKVEEKLTGRREIIKLE